MTDAAPRKRRLGRRLLAAGAAALAVVLLVGWGWLRAELRRPYAAWEGPHVDITLEAGLDAGSMLKRLGEAGVVRRPRLVRRWLRFQGGSQGLHAGEYRFDHPVSPLDVLDRLARGDVLLHSVTLPEGLTLIEIGQRIAEAGFDSEARLRDAFADPAPIRALDPQADDLEGYLFPDTYHFPRETTAEEIARTMVQRFVEMTGTDFSERARAAGLDLRQAVTLASMIEKETSVPDERRRISAVFHNRLERGMLMQCDPTVVYAHQREGTPVRRLFTKHLELDSPWNTYRSPGLPPGPIANPGLESMAAAIDPLETDELYFVAAPGGGHTFSRDLRQHQRAVAAWRAYSRSSR